MTERATISFDKENFMFLEQHAGKNRSEFINKLLRDARQKHMEDSILQANLEEREDEDYQNALSEWDVTLSDGLPDER